MAKDKPPSGRTSDNASRPARGPQDRNSNLRLPSNVTPDQAVRAMFSISKADAARIVASKPGRKRKG